MTRSTTETLIAAMRILARDIESGDGVANAAIAEAADRLGELVLTDQLHTSLCALIANDAIASTCQSLGQYRSMLMNFTRTLP